MLSLTKLANAEYLITQVARGIDEYYTGGGEAPGVWHGRWAKELGLEGIVEDDHLRVLLDGLHPTQGTDLLQGKPPRELRAFDATFSAPKSVSLLWAFGTDEIKATVAIAHVEAVTSALDVLEDKAALARQQSQGVRRQVSTHGLAVATFVHRTSREGDPQMHTHCVIPNLVQRVDGSCVALDGSGLYEWKKAVGSIYAEELRTRLTRHLGVAWGPDRNGTREMAGIASDQLRAFSKRTVAIEEHLAQMAIDHADRAKAMRADDAASLATRPAKDKSLTPERLRERWEEEADAVGLVTGDQLLRSVTSDLPARQVTEAQVFAHLVDPEAGVCARRSRFGEAHVVEAVAALGGGAMDADRILELSRSFLDSGLVVRIVEPTQEPERPTPARWSTVAHLATERHVLDRLSELASRPSAAVEPRVVDAVLAAEGALGPDQADAVRMLCGPGKALRLVSAPAGYGKTSTVHAASRAQVTSGRRVLGLATTHQAAGELRGVGIEAVTLARFRFEVDHDGLAPNVTLVLDEVSQVATRDAAWLLDVVVSVPGSQLWCLGDAKQGRAVRAGGLAAELERLAKEGTLQSAALTENRRQLEAAEREALHRFRQGRITESQAIRTEHGWEHDAGTPNVTRRALAEAVVADGDRLGVHNVVALTVSHADAEDLADRVRELRTQRGELSGPTLTGPGWSTERTYAAGDLVLVHANVELPGARLHNGTVLTVSGVSGDGLTVTDGTGAGFVLPVDFVRGRRAVGHPNLSHAWARTVDGAQGGTWDQVHLLGTAALDRYTGYVGQSRGRLATHTWNVTRVDDANHGGVVLRREPAEEVLSAMEREPSVAFAAHGDPQQLDRVLRAVRDQHLRFINRRPSDVGDQLDAAVQHRHQADREHHAAVRALEQARRDRASVGPIARHRPEGRRRLAEAEHRLARGTERLKRAQAAARAATEDVEHLHKTMADRASWDAEHHWRLDRVADIDAQLARHWAEAVLVATRQGDPLAFGLHRLRQARLTNLAELRSLEADLPPDRSRQLGQAQANLVHRQEQLVFAGKEAATAARKLDEAGGRRWGRRDKTVLARAERQLAFTRRRVDQAQEVLDRVRAKLDREERAVIERVRALRATADRRAELAGAAREFGMALDEIRAARVLDAARGQGAEHLTAALGPAPDEPARQAVWCGIATEVEAWRDYHVIDRGTTLEQEEGLDWLLGRRSILAQQEWDRMAQLVSRAPELLDTAPELTLTMAHHELSVPWHHALTEAMVMSEPMRPPVERSRGLELD
jgi:conjugative relaxase-like TrwC/TraI family protein